MGRRHLLGTGRRHLLPGIVLLLVTAGTVVGQEQEGMGTLNAHIRGLVEDGTTAEPLSTVQVVLTSESGEEVWSGVTDMRGRFRASLLRPGSYELTFRRIGYSTATESLTVGAGMEAEIRVGLPSEAVDVEPIVVTTSRRSRLEREGFYQREKYFSGEFFLHEDIEYRNPLHVQDLVRMTPGFRVMGGGGRPAAVFGRGGCPPAVFLNGVPLEYAPGDPTIPDPFDMVQPEQLEAMEVYSGQMTPAQFYTRGACGAIAMWTSTGDERGGESIGPNRFRAVLLAAAFIGGLRLLVF